jgi:protoporphyrinogen oxidase
MSSFQNDVLVLGAGLAGLSAGYVLSEAGLKVEILEKEFAVGGLAKTVVHGPFRFDLGGHRFFTEERRIGDFVKGLLGEEFVTVPRKSQILFRDRYIDYPLRPLNAVSALGVPVTWKATLDYALVRIKGRVHPREMISLEDWVVRHFGRTLFDIYFKEYSEKVWGIACQKISMEWVAERIKGLSLGTAIRNAFFPRGNTIRTLTDRFFYAPLGIGRIAERLKAEIEKKNRILCDVELTRLRHEDFRIRGAVARSGSQSLAFEGKAFISSVPVTDLVRMLDPQPPRDVQLAAGSLRFRDLVIVAVMLNRERATELSWLYIPERRISFGRIHEPANWGAEMAPAGKTLLVTEHFCFRGDQTWRASDHQLARRTIRELEELGFIAKRDVADWAVLRIPKAYPLLEVGYADHLNRVYDYLGRFGNLFLTGRGGTFKYYNMDHVIASGMETADRVIRHRVEGHEEEHEEWLLARQSA